MLIHHKDRILLVLLFVILILVHTHVLAWTKSGDKYYTDGSQSDVQSAIDDSSVGEIIHVPGGTFTWDRVSISHEIVLEGEGVNSTTILNSRTISCSAMLLCSISTDTSNSLRITGFTFKPAPPGGYSPTHIQINGDSEFRIDHCEFTGVDNSDDICNAIIIVGYNTYGVIDSNIFYDATNEVIQVKADNTTWSEDDKLGTDEFVFIEDNIFDSSSVSIGTHAVTSIYGARVCFRYNTLYGLDCDAHGHGSEVGHQGTRVVEYYKNKLYTDGRWTSGMVIRGGTGVIWGNEFYDQGTDQGWNDCVKLTEYRVSRDTPNDGCCPIASGGEGYPCYDQIGRGKNQQSSPLYIWGNMLDSDGDGILDSNASVNVRTITPDECNAELCTDYIKTVAHNGQILPDYYIDIQKPGYSPYTYPHPLRGWFKGFKGMTFSGGISTQ